MVTEKQGRELAERMKAPYIEASAKDNRVRLTQEIVFPHSFLRRFMELASCLAVEPKEQNQDWVVLMLPTFLAANPQLAENRRLVSLSYSHSTDHYSYQCLIEQILCLQGVQEAFGTLLDNILAVDTVPEPQATFESSCCKIC